MDIVVKSKLKVNLKHTVLSHGWVNLAPWDWDNGNVILSRPERLSSGQTTCIEVSQQNPKELLVRIDHIDGSCQ